MTDSKIFETISETIGTPSINYDIERAFTPIINNADLVSTFTKLSQQSPIFQKSLSSLNDLLKDNNTTEFLKGCSNFYSNVITISDELALIAEKAFEKIGGSLTGENSSPASKNLLGTIFFLLITSNRDTVSKSIECLNA